LSKEKKIAGEIPPEVPQKKRRSPFQKTVNVFLCFFIALFLLIIVAIGITQTSYFREWLLDTIISEVNSSIHGKINIGKIEGTFFTYLSVKDATLEYEGDTVIAVKNVEVRLSPLKIFLKQIYIRNVNISGVDVKFIKDSLGILNISKIFPAKETDTTAANFPFKIKVSSLQLSNINFTMQDYKKKSSTQFYDELNLEDLRINNFNLSLNATANINKKEFEANINNLSFNSNINNFNLKELSGNFQLSKKEISIKNFKLLTDRTNLRLNVLTKDLNIFDKISDKELKSANAVVELKVDKFNFDDLSSLVPATNILKGDVYADIAAEGKIGDLNIHTLNLEYLNTSLKCKGKILHLDEPSKMFITANFKESHINYDDVNKLLPSLSLPKFDGISMVNIDTLNYEGEPLNFKSGFALKINNGKLAGNAALDFRQKEIVYTVTLKTTNLNLQPFINISTSLNLNTTITGSGIDPASINASMNLTASGSSIGKYNIDEINLTSEMVDKKLTLQADGISDISKLKLYLTLNLENQNNPKYSFTSNFSRFNLTAFLPDSLFNNSINISFKGNGENFDPEKISGNFVLNISSPGQDSTIADKIDLNLNVKAENGNKKINLQSTLADFKADGNFSYKDLSTLVSNEIDKISKPLIDRINLYLSGKPDTTTQSSLPDISVSQNSGNKNTSPDLNINFEILFKDIPALSVLLKKNYFEFTGKLNGKMQNDKNGFLFAAGSDFDLIKFQTADKTYLFDSTKFNFNLSHGLNKYSLEDINLSTSVSINDIYFETELKNFMFDLSLVKNKLHSSAAARYNDKLNADFSFSSDLSSPVFKAGIENLYANYNGFEIKNKNPITLAYVNEGLEINNFNLYRGDAEIKLDGTISKEGNNNLNVSMKNFRGLDLGTYLLNLNPENIFDNNINLTAVVKGTFDSPEIKLNLDIDSISFHDTNFGSLKCNINYAYKYITSQIEFLDEHNSDKPRLQISGKLPVDLSLSNVEDRLPKNKDVDLSIKMDDFNVATFGDELPFIDKLRGILFADIHFTGTYNNLFRKGLVILRNASFFADANNLEYGAGLVLRLEDKTLYIDSCVVTNSDGVKNKGILRGRGKIEYEGLDISSMQFLVNGDLTVLTGNSRTATQSVYGDLYISTNGDIAYTSDKNGSFLKASITVDQANLIFPQTESTHISSVENFTYRYVVDTSTISKKQFEIQKLIAKYESDEKTKAIESKSGGNFDYDIRIKIKDDVHITFILARETNQKLIADLNGGLHFAKTKGISNVQGELKLLEGSTIDFIKTFGATGTLTFESDLSNPNLDITGIYKSTYQPEGQPEEDVAVKIKLKGPLKDLSKNFSKLEDNINVYEGAQNIQNDTPNPSRDKSDALWFVLTGKFTKDLTSQEKSKAFDVGGTATSVAGSLLGGVLNTYLGNYVRTLEVNNTGTVTKFNLTGNWKRLKYTFGGTTSVFQDLSHASIKLEYPLIENFSVRFERKESVSETSYTGDMVNEVGLKYLFGF
jgi:hypothetical protein